MSLTLPPVRSASLPSSSSLQSVPSMDSTDTVTLMEEAYLSMIFITVNLDQMSDSRAVILHLSLGCICMSTCCLCSMTICLNTLIWRCVPTPGQQRTPPAPGRRWWMIGGCEHHYPPPPDFLTLCWPSHLYR